MAARRYPAANGWHTNGGALGRQAGSEELQTNGGALGRQVSFEELQRDLMAQDVATERETFTARGRQREKMAERRRAAAVAAEEARMNGTGVSPHTGLKEGYVSGRASAGPRSGGADGSGGPYRPGRTIETHELLKLDAFDTQSAACDNHFEKSRPCPREPWGVSDAYMLLDSFEKDDAGSDLSQGKLKFNFMVQGVTRDQNIGTRYRVDTVIEIQVGAFCIPIPPQVPYVTNAFGADTNLPILTANPGDPAVADPLLSPLTTVPFCSRVIMYLEEINLQSFSDAHQKRHHFEFDATVAPTGDRLLLTPLDGWERYIFTDPIQDIHGLTIRFFNPDQPLALPRDKLLSVTPTTGTLPPQLEFRPFTGETHDLVLDDRIFVEGMNTISPVINRYVNRSEGLLVGGGTTPTAIRLNPDVNTTPLGAPPFAQTGAVNICIAKNRIRIPMRFRRVVDRLTNYIGPI